MSNNQSTSELEKQLQEQISFLKSLCRDYDNGNLSDGKRIAVSVRVLVHETRNSISLLKQLKIKNINFFDTSDDWIPSKNIFFKPMPFIGLACMRLGHTNHIPRCATPFADKHKKLVSFDKWWEKIVIVDNNDNKFRRRDIVLTVADQDGGAHVDPKLNPAYMDLKRNNSTGWQMNSNKKQLPIQSIELASLRQIGYEMLETISRVDYIEMSNQT